MTTNKYETLRVPAGWEIELRVHGNHEAILMTPPPSYFVTIDFVNRGFRAGINSTGPFMTSSDGKRGTPPSGRGWRQALVDHAVAYMKRTLVEVHGGGA